MPRATQYAKGAAYILLCFPVRSTENSCSWLYSGRFAALLLRQVSGLRLRHPKRNGTPLQAFHGFAVFADFPKLVLSHTGERLMRAAPGPIHFDAFDLRGFAQPYVLFQRRRSKGPAEIGRAHV